MLQHSYLSHDQYASSADQIKYIVGQSAFSLLMLNTISLIVLILYLVYTDTVIPDQYTFWFSSSVAFAIISLIFLIPSLFAIHREHSLRSEIVTDLKIMYSIVKYSDSFSEKAKNIISFINFYYLVFPLVLYCMLRYCNLKVIALDPSKFGIDYHKQMVPGLIVANLLHKDLVINGISENEVNNHFVKIRDRYFVKNKESATYLRLSIPEHKLLSSFGISENDILSSLIEIDKNDTFSYNDTVVSKVIKSSLILF